MNEKRRYDMIDMFLKRRILMRHGKSQGNMTMYTIIRSYSIDASRDVHHYTFALDRCFATSDDVS